MDCFGWDNFEIEIYFIMISNLYDNLMMDLILEFLLYFKNKKFICKI